MSEEPENINDHKAWKKALKEHIEHLKYREEEYNNHSIENAIRRDLTMKLRLDLENTLYKNGL
jgi:hypothetical protein